MDNTAHKAAEELAEKEASVAAWKHPADALDDQLKLDLVCQLAEVLTPVLHFIARGRLGGTMQHRSWVVLHETRLDLIHAESMDAYAKRVGLNPSVIKELVREFRGLVPAYRAPNQKSAATRAKMAAGARARQKLPTPPGKESFYNPGPSSGSAVRSLRPHGE